ncbi:hypothetical protein [Catellatospora sp. NPDC049133]|jgi:hypothetical protein|uniref:hypothetical protein n=1 Tax=Catellatospora sp. NPDC049133 TaxID=3155499 RepID=UPI0033F12899
MTTEPQQPVDDDTSEPDPRPAPRARTWSRPSGGTLAAVLIAFLLGGLVCGGLGLAVGLMAGHHHGHHGHDFDRADRGDRGPWGGKRDRDERVRPERLRDGELMRQLLRERLRQRGLDGQPMPWPLPPKTLPDAPVPAPTASAAPTATP